MVQDRSCPRCGERRGFLPVQRVTHGDGRRYERYFCASCKTSFEHEIGAVPAAPAPIQPPERRSAG